MATAAAVICVIVFGLGTSLIVATLTDAVFFGAPPGVARPERLARVYSVHESDLLSLSPASFSYPAFIRLRTAGVFAGIAAYSTRSLPVGDPFGQESKNVVFVTDSFFSVLAIKPLFGTLATPDGVVLSYGAWQRVAHRDSSGNLGDIEIAGVRTPVTAVLPPGFRGLDDGAADFFLPIEQGEQFGLARTLLADERSNWLRLVGRRQANYSLAATESRLNALDRRVGQDSTASRYLIRPLSQAQGPIRTQLGSIVVLLQATTALLLVITCVNVSALLLAHAEKRRRGIAVMAALGAGRGRLLALPIVEAGLLTVIGALGAAAVSDAGVSSLVASGAVQLANRVNTVNSTTATIGFAGCFFCLAGFGLLPGFAALVVSPIEALNPGSRGRHKSTSWFRLAAMFAQVTVAAALSFLAAALFQTTQLAVQSDYGMDVSTLAVLTPTRVKGEYQNGAALSEQLAKLSTTSAVSRAENVPFRSASYTSVFAASLNSEGGIPSAINHVDSAYFGAIGTRFVSKSGFSTQTWRADNRVTIVSHSLAKALGKARCIAIGGPSLPCFAVVGVIEDTHQIGVGEVPSPLCLVPLTQAQLRTAGYVIRTNTVATAALNGIRQALTRVDGRARFFFRPETVTSQLSEQTQPLRSAAAMIGILGAISLTLVAFGMAGTAALQVRNRSYDMAVRRALGASERRIARLFAGPFLIATALGILSGIVIGPPFLRLLALPLVDRLRMSGGAMTSAAVVCGLSALLGLALPLKRILSVPPGRVLHRP